MGISLRPPVTVGSPSIAGFAGVLVLVLATSVVPLPTALQVAFGLTGMGVVVLAWLRLGRSAARMSVRELSWTAAAWCLPLLFARPLFSGDIRSYLAQGVIAAKGLDVYRLSPLAALGANSPVTQQVSHYWQDTPAPYGPVWIAISRAIAHIAGENLFVTLFLNRLVELAGVALIAWALPRLARRLGVSPGIAMWLGLLNPLVLWHVVAGAHNDGLMIGLVLAGMEIALGGSSRPSRLVAALALLAVAANIKIVAAAAICCLGAAWARRWGRTAGRGALVMLGVLGASALAFLLISWVTGLGLGWTSALGSSTDVHSWMAPTNQLGFLIAGLGALAGANITSAAIAVTIRLGAVLGALACATVVWKIFRGRVDPFAGLGLVFALMLVTGPVVQPWYLLWAILPLAASVRGGRGRLALVVLSTVAAMLLPPGGTGAMALVAGYLGGAALLALIWRLSLGGWRGTGLFAMPPEPEAADSPVLESAYRTG
ncbi:polyprenol phosphomannose-dependent alpha 1,6 mannosyltransferase MptB [Amycolatopsis pigmentata]|uniref:Polyprenol phosphomannose-dependent alpha 1,6 mannosyltransferase MptB n=1 Tax=Amycolatopsis pigmentata TaxID=450801 RepID=A0ABW5FPS3_9PSEU